MQLLIRPGAAQFSKLDKPCAAGREAFESPKCEIKESLLRRCFVPLVIEPLNLLIARSALVFCGSKLDCMSGVCLSVCTDFFLSFSGHI